MEFEIPLDAKNADLHTFSSSTTWEEFVKTVSDITAIHASRLNLGYKFSDAKNADRVRVLRGEQQFAALFAHAAAWQAAKKCSTKTLHVILDIPKTGGSTQAVDIGPRKQAKAVSNVRFRI